MPKHLFRRAEPKQRKAAKIYFQNFCQRRGIKPETITTQCRTVAMVNLRREIAREMLAAGFVPNEIAIALKRHRCAVINLLKLRKSQRNQQNQTGE